MIHGAKVTARFARRRILGNAAAAFVVLGSAAGCGSAPSEKTETSTPAGFSGATIRFLVPDDCPAAPSIRLRAAEWEAGPGGGAKIEFVKDETKPFDLALVSGSRLSTLASLRPISPRLLSAAKLGHSRLPSVYRNVLCKRSGQVVAWPLGGDGVFLWLRGDLFDDAALGKVHEQQHASRLEPPATWEDYVRLAKFFAVSGKTKYGAAEAADNSPAGVRQFFVHAAARAKGPNWSTFALNSESGEPTLASPAFDAAARELVELKSVSAGPSEDVAVRAFLSGDAAMLLAPLGAVVRGATRENSPVVERLRVAPLPGSKTLFDPRTNLATKLGEANLCAHLATTGWFLAIGESAASPEAAEGLLAFLVEEQELTYLASSAKRGFLPVQPVLLDQPGKFVGYGLPARVVGEFFRVAGATYRAENWVADLRIAEQARLESELGSRLAAVLDGKQSPAKALSDASAIWRGVIDSDRAGIVRELRWSLNLPSLEP